MNTQQSKISAMMAMLFGGMPTTGRRRFKFNTPKKYPHHNVGECARRREQLQHMNQVRVDLMTKKQ